MEPNRFFKKTDKDLYSKMNLRFEAIYRDTIKGSPHRKSGPKDTVIHWAREVEYPWAIENACLKKGMRVADLGCGGSPLPYYLKHDAECGDVYGIDNYLFPNERMSLWGYKEHPSSKFPEIKWARNHLRNVNVSGLDRLFSISVFEHMSVPDRSMILENISRILTEDGLFIMTMDVDVSDPMSFVIDFMNTAKQYGLYVKGERDFNPPSLENKLGAWNVCGMVFGKKS
jgi:cyclopropane fatty-acyl-phospholipid synthase-like methyltransferase